MDGVLDNLYFSTELYRKYHKLDFNEACLRKKKDKKMHKNKIYSPNSNFIIDYCLEKSL